MARLNSMDLSRGSFARGCPAWKMPLFKLFARCIKLIRVDLRPNLREWR